MSDTQNLGTTTVTQIGLVVADIDQSIDAYCAVLGLPRPNVVITDEYEKARTNYRGHPTPARAKLAFFDLGQVSLELIEPVGEPSTWKEALEKNGEGFHHIAFQIKDTNKVVHDLEKKGIAMVQQGQYTGGMYTYMDATQKLGLVLELLENFD
jgi:methylmalonyl-CoA/ethylmalonyl-CoA epimerase